MKRSAVYYIRVRNLIPSFLRGSKVPEAGQTSAKEEQQKLISALPRIRHVDLKSAKTRTELTDIDGASSIESSIDMDSIRARGFMRHRFNYEPPNNLEEVVEKAVGEIDPSMAKMNENISKIDLAKNLKLKLQLLNSLGRMLRHTVSNPDLHKMETVGDVIEFYKKPVSNLTVYAKMARDKSGSLPGNLHVLEHPVRFHPEDKDAYHGGITAFPGRGGEVYSLRNKRIYRQFKPKEHWFDYEEQSFDYSRADKGMPWDPEIAKRADRYPFKKYNLETKSFRRVRSDHNEVSS